MGLIVDTSALVELERRKEAWDKVLRRASGEPVFLPAIVWGELQAGVYLADSIERALKRRAKLDKLRELVSILAFTAEIAEVWAELFGELQRKGTPVPANDLSVISTALFYGHRVLISSRNEAHFRAVARLDLVRI